MSLRRSLFGGPQRTLRTASFALGALSFVKNDWPMNFMAYALLALSCLPPEPQGLNGGPAPR